jgi:hypothetical protein
MARIKGFALRGLLRYGRQHALRPSVLAADLPEAIRPLFDRPILHGDFYPYEAFTLLLHRLDEKLGYGDDSLVRDVGRFAGREDVRGIFRLASFITAPETAVRRAPVFWNRYCDTGTMRVLESRPGYLRLTLEGFLEIDPLHCPLIGGWIEGLGEVWGVRNASVRPVECVRKGDPRCLFEGGWETAR